MLTVNIPAKAKKQKFKYNTNLFEELGQWPIVTFFNISLSEISLFLPHDRPQCTVDTTPALHSSSDCRQQGKLIQHLPV